MAFVAVAGTEERRDLHRAVINETALGSSETCVYSTDSEGGQVVSGTACERCLRPRGELNCAVEPLAAMIDTCRTSMASVELAKSSTLATRAQDLVRWILDQALEGIGPLPSGSDLADEYKTESYANDAERVRALIKWTVAKNTATGFVTGLGGALTLPLTIPGSLAASLGSKHR